MSDFNYSFTELIKIHCQEKRTRNLVDLNEITTMNQLKEAFTSPENFKNIGVLSQADLAQAYLKLRSLASIIKNYDLSLLESD